MNFFRRMINNTPLRRKLLYIYFIVILIPIFVLCYYLTTSLSNSFQNNTIDSYTNSISQLNQNLINTLYDYDEIVESVTYDKSFISFITKEYDKDIDTYTAYKEIVEPLLNRAFYKDNKLVIKIFNQNEQINFSNILTYDWDNMGSIGEKEKILSDNRKLSWNGIVKLNNRKYLNCYSVFNDYLYSENTIGIFSMYIDQSILYSLISKQNQTNNITYILDSSGTIISSSETVSIGNNVSESLAGMDIKKVSTGSKINHIGKGYLVIKDSVNEKELGISNWEILYLIPLESMSRDIQKIWFTSISLGLICSILSIIIVVLFSNNISHKVKILVIKIRQVTDGNLKVSIDRSDNDEIGELYRHFNTMVKNLDQLMTDIHEANSKIKEAEIRNEKMKSATIKSELLALQSQINPHYLFNTLESIRMKILLKGDRESSEIINLFADSFRSVLYSKGDIITVKDELKNIKRYFTIQKYRYENKISYYLSVDKYTLKLKIPKLLIQPLVENAIYHGLELKEGSGEIKIAVLKEDNYLYINVIDNGVGMSTEDLNKLISSIDRNDGGPGNFALKNIYSRLKLLYEENFRFSIESQANIGTSVEIYLPLEEL